MIPTCILRNYPPKRILKIFPLLSTHFLIFNTLFGYFYWNNFLIYSILIVHLLLCMCGGLLHSIRGQTRNLSWYVIVEMDSGITEYNWTWTLEGLGKLPGRAVSLASPKMERGKAKWLMPWVGTLFLHSWENLLCLIFWNEKEKYSFQKHSKLWLSLTEFHPKSLVEPFKGLSNKMSNFVSILGWSCELSCRE